MTQAQHDGALPSPPRSPSPTSFFPLSPSSLPSELEPPVIPIDDFGMIADDEGSPRKTDGRKATPIGKKPKVPGRRRRITYISRHFLRSDAKDESSQEDDLKGGVGTAEEIDDAMRSRDNNVLATPPVTPALPRPRVYYGVNIDEFSSDSSLTDVPDDIGPDPFLLTPPSRPSSSQVQAVKIKTPKGSTPTQSPYFPKPHKHRPTFLSTLPFPPLSHETFGLMQERLAHDPFRLLVATIFLNKTPGERAMPVFYQLMSRYPAPTDLANADVGDITSIIYELGFQNQRARKCVAMAKVWIENPPVRGRRYRKHNYPLKGDGKDVKPEEVLDDKDDRVAWEISHLPGLGPYSHDSWRMFCRDELRGVAESWNGEGVGNFPAFEPEWKRVVPLDKELRAYLTWMWLKEGWVWNKETGRRTKASDELMAIARGGGIVVEEKDSNHLIVKNVGEDDVDILKDDKKVGRTAGDYLPEVPT